MKSFNSFIVVLVLLSSSSCSMAMIVEQKNESKRKELEEGMHQLMAYVQSVNTKVEKKMEKLMQDLVDASIVAHKNESKRKESEEGMQQLMAYVESVNTKVEKKMEKLMQDLVDASIEGMQQLMEYAQSVNTKVEKKMEKLMQDLVDASIVAHKFEEKLFKPYCQRLFLKSLQPGKMAKKIDIKNVQQDTRFMLSDDQKELFVKSDRGSDFIKFCHVDDVSKETSGYSQEVNSKFIDASLDPSGKKLCVIKEVSFRPGNGKAIKRKVFLYNVDTKIWKNLEEAGRYPCNIQWLSSSLLRCEYMLNQGRFRFFNTVTENDWTVEMSDEHVDNAVEGLNNISWKSGNVIVLLEKILGSGRKGLVMSKEESTLFNDDRQFSPSIRHILKEIGFPYSSTLCCILSVEEEEEKA